MGEIFHNQDIRLLNNFMKIFTYQPSMKYEFKPKSSLPNLKIKNKQTKSLAIPILVMMWNNWNFHTLLVKVQNAATTLESCLAVVLLHQTHFYLPNGIAISLIEYIHIRDIKMHVYKKMLPRMFKTCINNSLKSKTSQISINN